MATARDGEEGPYHRMELPLRMEFSILAIRRLEKLVSTHQEAISITALAVTSYARAEPCTEPVKGNTNTALAVSSHEWANRD